MQVSLINWMFIDFTGQSSRMNQPTEYNPDTEQFSKPSSIYQNSNVSTEAIQFTPQKQNRS